VFFSLIYSAGVGHTGTYIILDTIIRKIQSGEDNVDIFGDILNIRNCRMHMVQTEVNNN
jgi:protein tyrosine phosphatase